MRQIAVALATGLIRTEVPPGVRSRTGVREIAVPQSSRDLSELAQIDFEDAYLVDLDPTRQTAEQWAHLVFDDAPLETRLSLWSGWITLGLRLALPTSPDHVLGWEVRETTPDLVLLGARSRVGMPAELLLRRYENAILFDTFVQQNNPAARAAWTATEAIHRRVVPAILEQFRCRERVRR